MIDTENAFPGVPGWLMRNTCKGPAYCHMSRHRSH